MTYTDFYFYPKLFALLFVVGLLQCLFHKKQNVANIISKAILLAFSFYTLFYYNWQYALCLFGVIGVTYIGAIVIDRKLGCHRKHLTTLFVSILVITLGVFKYLNFFAGTFCKAVHLSWTDINIILPIGISFYIFSAISYLLDVSWGTMKAEKNVLDVALFLAFFPKIVCGPIVKGYEFIPQLKEYRRIQWENVCDGMQIYVFGLFKKMVLADHIAVFVNDVYSKPVAYDNATIWLAVFSYFLQLYFDFSGYSDMAIGLFKILGYDVAPNFNLPFVATNISEFWNRWHISLGSWLTEYIYNPLAIQMKRAMNSWDKAKQKRFKMLPSYVACIITFLISGIWHGAGMTFVLFGIFHGISSVAQQMYARWCKKHHKVSVIKKGRIRYSMDIMLNYVLVTCIQVFFRADSVSDAVAIFRWMFVPHVGMNQIYTWSLFAYVILIIATVVAYMHTKNRDFHNIQAFYPIQNLSTIPGLTIFFVVCGMTMILAYFGETYFIYGQF